MKTCLLYLAMSESNKTYIIEINPFTKEKIYHTYRMTQPNHLIKCEFNPITYKETKKVADLKLTDFNKFKHHFCQSKATKNKGWYRNEWERIKYGYISRLTNPQYKQTYIDTYQEPNEDIDEDDEDDETIRTVSSYLYGVPYS